jgi:hypothetical protein
MKPKEQITCWYRFIHKKNKFEFNHIQNGWNELLEPKPQNEQQAKDWKGARWKKTLGILKDGKVTEL